MAELDKRELILDRLKTLLALPVAGGGPALKCYRNRANMPENARPAVVVMDADESADEAAFNKGRPANGPNLVGMTPEIAIYETGQREEIGTKLNALRLRVIKAILNDADLAELVADGDIRYEGMATDLAEGRRMEGVASLQFTFTYALKPSKL